MRNAALRCRNPFHQTIQSSTPITPHQYVLQYPFDHQVATLPSFLVRLSHIVEDYSTRLCRTVSWIKRKPRRIRKPLVRRRSWINLRHKEGVLFCKKEVGGLKRYYNIDRSIFSSLQCVVSQSRTVLLSFVGSGYTAGANGVNGFYPLLYSMMIPSPNCVGRGRAPFRLLLRLTI